MRYRQLEHASPMTMRVAIIHDYLNQYGGAERVLEALHALYPTAPVYTSIYDPAATRLAAPLSQIFLALPERLRKLRPEQL